MTDKEYGYPGLDMSVDITGAVCECGQVPYDVRTEQGFYVGTSCRCGDYRPKKAEAK